MALVIKAEDLSKQYRLGLIGTGTLSHDLNRWWAKIRGKEDPFLKVSEKNVRDQQGESEYVWALKDINFEVNSGEVLGIIGRNGAGKSTLLKILSRVTGPTTGVVKVKGRIASLLEVGTGFHHELTGRENIFLNGAILGMTKGEIQRKLEEIVDFAGVERYIDTPVKRYSSGMFVRLAFAVAAHLEPEILIIDEVLAVGDLSFQKKCLGKMKDVAGEGRTVLFVSHNMESVSKLCTRAMLLQNGQISHQGEVSEVLNQYYSLFKKTGIENVGMKNRRNRTNGACVFTDFKLTDKTGKDAVNFTEGESMNIRLTLKTMAKIQSLGMYIGFRSAFGYEMITNLKKSLFMEEIPAGKEFEVNCYIENIRLRSGNYSLYIGAGDYKCHHFYDLIDQNVDLPIISIYPHSEDPHLAQGYFSQEFQLTIS